MYRGSAPELYGPLIRGNGRGEVDDRICLVFEVWAEYGGDLEQVPKGSIRALVGTPVAAGRVRVFPSPSVTASSG